MTPRKLLVDLAARSRDLRSLAVEITNDPLKLSRLVTLMDWTDDLLVALPENQPMTREGREVAEAAEDVRDAIHELRRVITDVVLDRVRSRYARRRAEAAQGERIAEGAA